jgi:hypothetical protein
VAALDRQRRLDGLALLAQEGRRDGLGLDALAARALGQADAPGGISLGRDPD